MRPPATHTPATIRPMREAPVTGSVLAGCAPAATGTSPPVPGALEVPSTTTATVEAAEGSRVKGVAEAGAEALGEGAADGEALGWPVDAGAALVGGAAGASGAADGDGAGLAGAWDPGWSAAEVSVRPAAAGSLYWPKFCVAYQAPSAAL